MALNQHTRYVPPHPQQGTPYHRYVLLVLPQASPTEPIDVPVFEEADRLGFDLRAFADKYGLDGARGGGAHMFRSVWDTTVSHIYKHTLSESESAFRPGRCDACGGTGADESLFVAVAVMVLDAPVA